VREAAQSLSRRGWARLASYHGSRATKYRHLLDDALGLAPGERALLCVLMLRGPQTLGELKQNSERMHQFAELGAVEQTLDRLTERELGRWLERRPGQKEARYTHLLEEREPAAAEPEPAPTPPSAPAPADDIGDEIERLRQDVAELRQEFDALRAQLTSDA
jgi:uncharacterized protein YceH (UPF0502 family)